MILLKKYKEKEYINAQNVVEVEESQKRKNTAQYWECCDNWEYYDVQCDLCNGEGYTEHEYKPRMIQDGWE